MTFKAQRLTSRGIEMLLRRPFKQKSPSFNGKLLQNLIQFLRKQETVKIDFIGKSKLYKALTVPLIIVTFSWGQKRCQYLGDCHFLGD